MIEKACDPAVPHRIKHTVADIQSLEELPGVVARAVGILTAVPFSCADLAAVVETSPSLAACVLSWAWQQGLDLDDLAFSVQRVLEKIPVEVLRDQVLSVGLCHEGAVRGSGEVPSRADLVCHSLAVAYASRRIAEASPRGLNVDLAYLAGLLHDIGKLALHQVMPKGFTSLVEQARSLGLASHAVEQRELGTDHAALGRLLARKWHFPEDLQSAIWLHHSPAAGSRSPGGCLARCVHVADAVVRASAVGCSGSFDPLQVTPQMAEWLDLDIGVLQAMGGRMPEVIHRLRTQLEWGGPDPWSKLADVTRGAALQLSRTHAQLAAEQRTLQGASAQMEFLLDFWAAIPSALTVLDLAEHTARRWQRLYQTGKVCLLLFLPEAEEVVAAAMVEGLGAGRQVLLEGPDLVDVLAEALGGDFGVYDAGPLVERLNQDLGVDWDPNRTRWVPLTFGREAFGLVVFELHYPADADRIADHFKVTARGAAVGLYLMMSCQRHEQTAEDLAGLLSEWPTGPAPEGPRQRPADLIEAVAEVAAGLAHELNDPLVVISGRAQLLAEGQVDEPTRRSLQQIQDQAHQIASLAEGLMSYAEPAPPRRENTALGQILDEAVELARQRLGGGDLDLHVEMGPDAPSVFVDSAQAASALSNILVNAFQSYAPAQGPVEVRIERDPAGSEVRIHVQDRGCGMDGQTRGRATLPFFSARPAGRKRGLGLAFADRLIRLNDGRLAIASTLGTGTTVTVSLSSGPRLES